jgi:hypothetical protein
VSAPAFDSECNIFTYSSLLSIVNIHHYEKNLYHFPFVIFALAGLCGQFANPHGQYAKKSSKVVWCGLLDFGARGRN